MKTGKITIEMDGNAWCATREGFINLQESPAGFSLNPMNALASLLLEENVIEQEESEKAEK